MKSITRRLAVLAVSLVVQPILLAAPVADPQRAAMPAQAINKAQIAAAKQAPTVEVPNLRGSTLDQANAALAARRLSIGNIQYVPQDPDSSSPGTITFQNPPSQARVNIGTRIDVRIVGAPPDRPTGTGVKGTFQGGKFVPPPQQALVPPLRGKTLDEARAILAGGPFSLGPITYFPPAADAPLQPTVVRQYPAEGSPATVGSGVALWVVQRPSAPRTRTPGLVGRLLGEEIRALLAERRLRLGNVTNRPSGDPPGTIVDQAPAADVEVDVDTGVDVVVAIPPEAPPPEAPEMVVPYLVGRNERELGGLLDGLGFRLGQIGRRPDAHRPGTVIDQAPEPGAVLARGGRIDVVVADPPERALVAVPPLTGMRLADARQAVESAGLGLALSADVAGDVGGRTIAAQTPPAGSLVPPGATVTVRLASSGVPPWIPLAGTGALAGLLGYQIARRRHRPRRVRPGDVRARATDPQVTTEVQHRGDPVDVEVRIQADVGRDAAVVTEGLGIISESSERQ